MKRRDMAVRRQQTCRPFEEFVRAHRSMVVRRATRLVGPECAEDVAAEVFVAAARAVREGRVHVLTAGWLMTVTRNRACDHLRRSYRERTKQRRLAAATAPQSPGPDEGLPLELGAVGEALARCSARQQAALCLRYVEGRSASETAQMLGISPVAVDSLVVRAKAALRHHYLAAA